MKRLSALILSAGLFGSAAFASDPVQAPTVPSIPAPVLAGTTLAPTDASAGITPATVRTRGTIDKVLHMPRLLTSSTAEDRHETPAKQAAPTPVPPAMPAYHMAPPAIASVGDCGPSCCANTRSHTGECWNKFKAWFCYAPEPIKLGLTPTPYHVPYASQFDCASRPGCATGNCTSGNCSSGNCGPRVSNCTSCRGTAGGCLGAPVNNGPGIPGYRFAAPENKAVASPVAQPVVSTSYKPAPTVPYK